MSLSLTDVFFLTSAVFIIGIFILKLYNVMHKSQKYGVIIVMISFILAIIMKYIALVSLLNGYLNLIYLSIHNILTLLYVAIWFFFIIEIVMLISAKLSEKAYKPSKPDYIKE